MVWDSHTFILNSEPVGDHPILRIGGPFEIRKR